MAIPTIAPAGAANGLLLITDHDGTVYRVPKASVCHIKDSSNDHAKRLDIRHADGEITLIFETDAQIAAILEAIDALY